MTTLPPSRADCLEIWESQTHGKLRAFPGLYWNFFAITGLYSLNILKEFLGSKQPAGKSYR